MDVLPLALMRIRMTTARLLPYEIMSGRPPPLIQEVMGNLLQRGRMEVLAATGTVGKGDP